MLGVRISMHNLARFLSSESPGTARPQHEPSIHCKFILVTYKVEKGANEVVEMECPYCLEEVKDGAVACPYCGRDLSAFKLIKPTSDRVSTLENRGDSLEALMSEPTSSSETLRRYHQRIAPVTTPLRKTPHKRSAGGSGRSAR
jgi:hypothetical protein